MLKLYFNNKLADLIMSKEAKIQESNPPLYFIPKNIIITSLTVITATIALAAFSALAVFFLNHYEVLQGLYSIVAYASVGGAGALLTFAEFVAGMIALAIACKKNIDAVIIEEDVKEGNKEGFDNEIQTIM